MQVNNAKHTSRVLIIKHTTNVVVTGDGSWLMEPMKDRSPKWYLHPTTPVRRVNTWVNRSPPSTEHSLRIRILGSLVDSQRHRTIFGNQYFQYIVNQITKFFKTFKIMFSTFN